MTVQPGFTPHVRVLGQGPRKALALHCTMAFSGVWAGVAQQVGDRLTLIAPDMPSHGKSADWDGQSSFVDTVFTAAESCLSEPMDLIGHSFGAATAVRLAIEHPDLVRSLTLYEPVLFSVAKVDDPMLFNAHLHAMEPLFDAFRAGDAVLSARLFNRLWSPDGPGWDTLPDALRAAMARAVVVVPGTDDFLIKDLENLLGRLDRITMPCLLLRGALTDPVMGVVNEGLARRLPDARSEVIDGAGHMGPITHPSQTAQLWTDLLARAG